VSDFTEKQRKIVKAKQYRQFLESSKRTLGLQLSKLEEDLNELETSLHLKEKQKEKLDLMLIAENLNGALCPQRRMMQMDVQDEATNKITDVNNELANKTAEYLDSKEELCELIVKISTAESLMAKSRQEIAKQQQKKEDEQITEIFVQKMYLQREVVE
jgi:hypothetical protein